MATLSKMYLISVGLSSYFVEILVTWSPTRFRGQIFNFGGLDLIFTMGKSRRPKSSISPKSKNNMIFWPTISENMFIFSRIKLIFLGNTFDMVSNKNLLTDF